MSKRVDDRMVVCAECGEQSIASGGDQEPSASGNVKVKIANEDALNV
jgi:hypothetical protein